MRRDEAADVEAVRPPGIGSSVNAPQLSIGEGQAVLAAHVVANDSATALPTTGCEVVPVLTSASGASDVAPVTDAAIAEWPADQCPVDLSDPDCPKVYGQPRPPLSKKAHLPAVAALVEQWNVHKKGSRSRIGLTVGELQEKGIKNPHRTLAGVSAKPGWKDVIICPGSGNQHQQGYHIKG